MGQGLPMSAIPTATPLVDGPRKAQPCQPGEAVSLAGRGATFKNQARALFRKNAVYQRRNWCSNVCLLSAPIFFCLLLFGIQIAINKLLLTGDDYACGCKCTQCCYQGNPNNCTAITSGTCPYVCLEKSTTECGIRYSTARQAYFCAIPHPSSWPAVLQVPAASDRAEPWRPDPVLLYTGRSRRTADALSANLLPKPAASVSSFMAVREYVSHWNQTGGPARGAVPGEVLSLMGLTLGTSAKILAGVYVETALAKEQLYALWPAGTCERLNLAGRTNVTLLEMVSAMVNTSNSAGAAAALNRQLASLVSGASGAAEGGAEAEALAAITSLSMNCTDVPSAFLASAAEIEQRLYCGYFQSRCGGGSGPQQLAAAYDWKATDGRRFEPAVFYNDTYGLATSTQATVYQRIPAALNLAVNGWMRTFVGANASANLVGVQEAPKSASSVTLDFSALLGPLFFTWVVQMLLPVFLMQLVYEKEKRLRMMMKMHGLGDGAYWLVTYTWFSVLYIAYMAVFIAFGSLIGLNMFTKNSVGVQLVLYFLFGQNMIAFAFLLSCFFTSSKTATIFAYLVVFGTGLIGSLLLSRLMADDLWYMTLVQLVPSFSLFRGLYEFGEYATLGTYRGMGGMAFGNLLDAGNGTVTVWAILFAEWFVFMTLAWYLEQVFASGTGNRRHPLYFLDAFRKDRKAAANARLNAAASKVPAGRGLADDVAAEHTLLTA